MTKRRSTAAWLFAALTSLAGCSLATDLDSLTASRHRPDASLPSAPADAPSPTDGRPITDAVLVIDTGARFDGNDAAVALDASRDLDPDSFAIDADTTGAGQGDDGAVGAPGDGPVDNPSLPDMTATSDSRLEDDAGRSPPPPAGPDAATDGPAGVDGKRDAAMMCARLPSHDATLYLMDNASKTTGCGYLRAGLTGYLAAVDPATYAGSASCGACLRVETAAAVVEAQLVEVGPDATVNPSAVAVSRAALSMLVPDGSTFVNQGVSWRFVPCTLPPATAMTFQFQEGSNANYAALLIQRHRFRLASVEYRSNGSYRSLTRASYNYWVAANGMGGGPFTLRITDVHGHSVEQAGVPLKPGVIFQGQVQFPECSN